MEFGSWIFKLLWCATSFPPRLNEANRILFSSYSTESSRLSCCRNLVKLSLKAVESSARRMLLKTILISQSNASELSVVLGAAQQGLSLSNCSLNRLGGRNVAGGETEAEIKSLVLLLKLLLKLLLG